MKISEVPEFSILPYTQNRKLGISQSFIFFKFLVVCKTRIQKYDLKEKTLSLQCGLRRKNVHFRGLQVFNFVNT